MKWLKISLFLTVLVFVIVFVLATDLSKVLDSLREVGVSFLLLLVVSSLAYMAGTIGWKITLGRAGKNLTLPALFWIRLMGETVSLVHPTNMVGGDTVKMYFLGKRQVDKQSAIISILVSRVLIIFTQLLLFSFAFGYLLISSKELDFPFQFPSLKAVFYLIILVGGGWLIWYIISAPFLKALFRWAKPPQKLVRLSNVLKTKTAIWWQAIKEYFLQNPSAVAWSATWFFIHWLLGSMEFYVILHLLHVKVTLVEALLMDMGVVLFKSAGAFIPGQLGIEEYGNKVMLGIVGISDPEIWLTASILRRTRQVFWIALGMFAYLLWYDRKRRKIKQELTKHGDPFCQP